MEADMNFPKFQIYKGNDNQYYFRLFASNGQNILSSEGYTSKTNCQKGIESVKANASNPANYVIRDAANGQVYFVLQASNKQVIGNSQMYANKRNCEEGIQSVQNNTLDAPIEDTTV